MKRRGARLTLLPWDAIVIYSRLHPSPTSPTSPSMLSGSLNNSLVPIYKEGCIVKASRPECHAELGCIIQSEVQCTEL